MDQLLLDTQQAHRKKLSEIAEHQTEIQGELTELANKFLAHMEHEEGLMARATEQLTEHAVKISYLERMQYALWGAVGTLAAVAIHLEKEAVLDLDGYLQDPHKWQLTTGKSSKCLEFQLRKKVDAKKVQKEYERAFLGNLWAVLPVAAIAVPTPSKRRINARRLWPVATARVKRSKVC